MIGTTMSTSIRYLRLYLHRPAQANGTAGGREAIGYLSQYGDILRVSFDEAYIRNPQRPTLSLSYQGADEAATQQILASARDARLVRTDGRWPVYFQTCCPKATTASASRASAAAAPTTSSSCWPPPATT